MSDDNQTADDSRRDFMKGAAATGLSVAGLTAFTGNAAAQQDIQRLNVRNITLNRQTGLLNVNVSNVNVLQNVNVEIQDVVVTVIGGDVLSDIGEINILRFEEEVVQNVLNNNEVLNNLNISDNTVQVAVLVLSTAGEIVAAGSGATNSL